MYLVIVLGESGEEAVGDGVCSYIGRCVEHYWSTL